MSLKVLVLFSCFFGTILGDEDTNQSLAFLINLALKKVFDGLQTAGTYTLKDEDSHEFNDGSVIGVFSITDLHVFSLNTLTYDVNAQGTEEDVIIDVALTFSNLGLATGYVADIAIIDQIPIYGDGNIIFQLSDVKLHLYLALNTDPDNPHFEDNVSLQLSFRDAPSGIVIDGFWKSPEVSQLLSTVFSAVVKELAMWWTYNNDCINCVLTQILKLILTKPDTPSISCDCLENQTEITKEINGIISAWIKNGHPVEPPLAHVVMKNKNVQKLISNVYNQVVKEFMELQKKNLDNI